MGLSGAVRERVRCRAMAAIESGARSRIPAGIELCKTHVCAISFTVGHGVEPRERVLELTRYGTRPKFSYSVLYTQRGWAPKPRSLAG
eukprot:3042331-Prymnesium_polylepis.2